MADVGERDTHDRHHEVEERQEDADELLAFRRKRGPRPASTGGPASVAPARSATSGCAAEQRPPRRFGSAAATVPPGAAATTPRWNANPVVRAP